MTPAISWMAAFLVPALAAAQESGDTRSLEPPAVVKTSGSLKVWRGGAPGAESVKDQETVRLLPTDRLGTGAGQSASVTVEGTLRVLLNNVKIGREEGLSIERSDARKIVFHLHGGAAAVQSFEHAFEIHTDHGRVEGKDAYLVVEASDQAMRVFVFQGKPVLANSTGQIELESNQGASAEKDKPPQAGTDARGFPNTGWITAAEAPENLLRANPGFELEFRPPWCELWGKDKGLLASIDTKMFRSGARSSRLDFRDCYTDKKFPPEAQVTLVPGQRYVLRAWVRSQGYTFDGRPGKLQLTVIPIDPNIKEGRESVTAMEPVSCEGAWRCLQMIFAAPVPTCRVRIFKEDAGEHRFTGTIWTDDWFLGPMPSPK